MNDHVSSALHIQDLLDARLLRIEEHCNGDVLTTIGPIEDGLDALVRQYLENIEPRREKLVVIVETPGGYIEVTERIVNTMRHFYKEVDFIVPSHALSAGTVLVMSGDQIYMDYYSVLGPIDPQVQTKEGRSVPALGYLAKYEQLISKSGVGAGLSSAEIAYLVERFDPGEIHAFEQARKLSIDLLETWLVAFKFKDWLETETNKKTVTPEMKKTRAREIGVLLNDIERWKSHGRGIHMEILRKEGKLIICDFAADKEFNQRIKSYYRLLKDHMAQQGHMLALHTHKSSYTGI